MVTKCLLMEVSARFSGGIESQFSELNGCCRELCVWGDGYPDVEGEGMSNRSVVFNQEYRTRQVSRSGRSLFRCRSTLVLPPGSNNLISSFRFLTTQHHQSTPSFSHSPNPAHLLQSNTTQYMTAWAPIRFIIPHPPTLNQPEYT